MKTTRTLNMQACQEIFRESLWRMTPVCMTLFLAVGCASAQSLIASTVSPVLPAQTAGKDAEKEAHPTGPAEKTGTAQTTSTTQSTSTSPTEQTKEPAANAPSQKGELALLKIEVMSLKEKMAALQRKMDVILKGQRSGLYDDAGMSALGKLSQARQSQKNPVPPLTSEGPIDRFENDSNPGDRDKAVVHEKPDQLVNRAEMLLEQREFGKVAQVLENFQQRFPNNGLSAVAELTLAEAYVELKSAQQALTHIRTFYLQHPNDVRLVKAKWLEAKSQELLNSPQKASQLFLEVIALDPQSQLARRARADLERMNGGNSQ